MSNSKDSSQQYLKTRLFLSKSSAAHSKNQKLTSTINARSAEETFQTDSFHGAPPKQSIYGKSQIADEPQKTEETEIGTWVTVIGVIPGHVQEIISYFSKFGTILRADDTPGNWVYLEFASTELAKNAVESCNNSPQIIIPSMAVTCKMGRIKCRYVPQQEKPPQAVFFDSKREGVVIPKEKRSIVESIYDSIF